MSKYTLILCEGAHDLAGLTSLVTCCSGWQREKNVPNVLPQSLGVSFPRLRENRYGAPIFDPLPKYLCRGDQWLEIRQLNGIKNVLGDLAVDLLRQARPDAVGVVVDANDEGVESRVKAFHDRFRELWDHATQVKVGRVVRGNPRLGLWVAPNNKSAGRMEDSLLKAAARAKPKLVACGKRFATSLERLEPGDWSAYRHKAILGAMHQTVMPGASLAVGLEQSECWFDSSIANVPPFKKLLQFIEDLAKP